MLRLLRAEVTFWNPDANGKLVRTSRVPDVRSYTPSRALSHSLQTAPGTSRFPHYVLHQGRIERFFLDNMYKYGTDFLLAPHRPR
jgi:phenol 2-monooxygenase